LLVIYSPDNLPRLDEIGVDGRVLAFTLAISLATGLVFGLAPALAASKMELNEVLKEGGRHTGGGARERRFQHVMVVGAVALALVLMVGAGLMIQSFWRLQRVDPGFQAENLLAAELSLPASRYRDVKQISSFHRRLLDRIDALPGVRSVGGAAYLPFGGRSNEWSFEIEGRPPEPSGQKLTAGWRPVTPNYFQTMGIPLIRGRHFTEQDDEAAPGVAIINESTARVFWPGEDPMGRRFNLAKRTYSIVGVVKDVKHFRLDSEAVTEMYFPYPQLPIPWRLMTVVVRTESAPDELASAVRAAVLEIDKDQPVYNVRTVESLLDNSVSRSRFYLLLMSTFAVLALVMACLGLYGVMNYTVTQRTHEIGIRLAMGAQPRDVLRLVGGRGLTLALSGVGIGLIGAYGLTRVMATLLYGVSPTDLLTFAAISLLLIAVALLACYVPTRRATKVDPMIALRYE
jgi:putative ABC transport system permease protein